MVFSRKIGFYGVFSISASLYLFSFTYGLLYLPESRAKLEKPDSKEKKSFLKDFFDKDHVIETFKVAFKKGENKRRQRVILLMIAVMVIIGPLHGEMAVTYLFTRFRFNWSEVEFSIFSTYAMLTGLVGKEFAFEFLQNSLIGPLLFRCSFLRWCAFAQIQNR